MINGPHARSSIDRQWIKANVLGAIANAITGIFGYGLNQLLGVSTDGAQATGFAFYAVFLVATNGASFALYGFLLGIVLRQKLPAFPMRSWVNLHAVFGVAFSALTAYASMRPEVTEPPDPTLYEVTGSIMIGAFISGSIIGAFLGTMQALILRPAARELGAWIKFSAIAGGPVFALVVATASLEPGGFGTELITEAAIFAGSVLTAFIMLPAVWRLLPR